MCSEERCISESFTAVHLPLHTAAWPQVYKENIQLTPGAHRFVKVLKVLLCIPSPLAHPASHA